MKMKEEFEDTKGVIRMRNSKKDNTMVKRKRKNDDLQNTTGN